MQIHEHGVITDTLSGW